MTNCTPFYGGTLSLRYQAGFDDAATLHIAAGLPPVEPDPTTGCSAFPIAPELVIRSVSPPGTGGNAYPDSSAFHYPPNPPAYEQFIYHVPDAPLGNARPGYVFRLWTGGGPGNFAFLRWNKGINASNQTLANSLAWPGDIRDYSDHGDGGEASTPLYPHVVRGFVDYYDNTDLSLNIDNWVTIYTGTVSSTAVYDALNEHIDHGRLLRLPVFDEVAGSGSDFRVQAYRFGLFRLHGHNLSSGWLLLEFAGWDDSCGQPEPGEPPPTPTMTATLTGAATITPTATPAPPTPTATATATSTPLPTATATPTAVPTTTPTPTPTATATAVPTTTPTATATSMPLPTATASSTAVPTTTATATATTAPTATATPTAVPPPAYYLYLPFVQQVDLSFVYEQNSLSGAIIAHQEKGE
jgi:hypothetical protein